MQEIEDDIEISIIIPVFNEVKYTSSILKEISNKCHSNYEIILIDDGSIDKYTNEGTINDLYVINHEINKGVNFSRNEGVENAHGKYIRIINNDILLEDYLDITLRDLLEEGKGKVACPYSTRGMMPRRMPLIRNQNNICGWCFMMKKEDWIPIPDDLYTRYGDNWIYEHYRNNIVREGKCHHFGSRTLRNIDYKPQVSKEGEIWNSKYQPIFDNIYK